MRTATALIDANGKPGKIIVLLKGGEETLREYTKEDQPRSGNTFECFVLTAPGDIISVDITADANTADVFDLEVDGILRASIASRVLAKAFHGTINKVCYKAKTGSKRDGAKYCAMTIKRRDESMDATFSRDGIPSPVSSLVIKAWRKNPNADAQSSVTEEATESAVSKPQILSYEEYSSWQELKRHISKEGPQPPFEIDFIDPKQLSRSQKEKIDDIHKRKPENYILIASFVFNLQSTTNLSALGFEDVPTYTPTPLPAKPPKVKKPSKARKNQVEGDADDEDKLEDDAVSVVDAVEDKEPPMVSKPEPEPKFIKSESTPMSKPKAPLPTFGPPKTAIEVLNLHASSKSNSTSKKKKADPQTKLNSGSGRETEKSLNFHHSEMFSKYDTTRESSQDLQPSQIVGAAHGSTADFAENRESDSINGNIEVGTSYVAAIQYIPPMNDDKFELDVEKSRDLTDANLPKAQVLQGENGNPAHKAFLARADTQETESPAESYADDSVMSFETSKDPSAHIKDEREQRLSREASLALNIANNYLARTAHTVESPEYEPITPPISAKKPAVHQQGREAIEAQRLAVGSQELLQEPNGLLQSFFGQSINQCTLSTSQATTASTQGEPSHPPPGNIFNLVRASSPAFSEATEIADLTEIQERVRNSRRTVDNNSEFQYQYLTFENGHHTSPLLRSAKTSIEDISMLDIETTDVRKQVREFWKHKSQSPTSSSTSPHTRKRIWKNQDQNLSFIDSNPLRKLQTEEKRKADAISGNQNAESEEPRKSIVAPAVRKAETLEQKMIAAKAKLAAATERNRKLEEERQAALRIKKKNEEVEALIRKAEEMERANIGLEAEINDILESNKF